MAKQLLWLVLLAGCAPEPRNPGPAAPPAESRRTRVLYVENYPRWEYRYLHNALVRDTSFDTHCFLVSADPSFPQPHSLKPEDPTFAEPLWKLPATLEALLKYDVVILGDVGPDSWPAVGALLEKFVADHGRGLILIAGEEHMPKKWKGTELEATLPVETLEDATGDNAESGFHLTEAGKRSPLVALASDGNAILELWEDSDGKGDGLKHLQWVLLTRCKSAAQTLVETGPGTERAPLFVTAQHGKGRVFFSATDETWRWRYRTGDEPHFLPFWRRVIEWAGHGE